MRQNEHFHTEEVGCKTTKYTLSRPDITCLTRDQNYLIEVCWCEIHEILTCRCGWEFRWHGGKHTILETKRKWVWKLPELLADFYDHVSEEMKNKILITRAKYESSRVLQKV